MGIPAAIECPGADVSGRGTIGPGNQGFITEVVFIEPAKNCKPTAKARNLKEEEVANACEALKSVEAINLPWLTELFLGNNAKGESVFLDKISSGGKGEPAGLYECKTALGTVDDTCTEVSAASTVEIHNETSDINAVSPRQHTNETTESLKSTIGGAENGLGIGEGLVEVMGGTLAASEVPETEI